MDFTRPAIEYNDARSAHKSVLRDRANRARYWKGATFPEELVGRSRECHLISLPPKHQQRRKLNGIRPFVEPAEPLNVRGQLVPEYAMSGMIMDRQTFEPVEIRRHCGKPPEEHPHCDPRGKSTKRDVFKYMQDCRDKRVYSYGNKCWGSCEICNPPPSRLLNRLANVRDLKAYNRLPCMAAMAEIDDINYEADLQMCNCLYCNPEPTVIPIDVEVHATTHFSDLVDQATRKYMAKTGIDMAVTCAETWPDLDHTDLFTPQITALDFGEYDGFSYDELTDLDDASDDETWSIVSDEDEEWQERLAVKCGKGRSLF